jgi:hypothetical protein
MTGEKLTIDEIVIGDPADAWASAGFAIDGATTDLGTVRLRFVGRDDGKRIRSWSLRGLPHGWAGDLDGLPTEASDTPVRAFRPSEDHPLGIESIDHVVVASPDLGRTVAAFGAAGLEAKNERRSDTYGAPMRQVFYRMGEVILELIGAEEPSGDGPTGFFGLALTVTDLDQAVAQLGERVGAIKDAVQPGRRIATMRHKEFGMSVAIALMSPEPHP